jgi:hypothetical protein
VNESVSRQVFNSIDNDLNAYEIYYDPQDQERIFRKVIELLKEAKRKEER